MCFNIDTKNPDVKVAETDIVCYKVLELAQMDGQDPYWRSSIRNFRYTLGETYSLAKKLSRTNDDTADEILEGFHSYSSEESVYSKAGGYLNGSCKFIIPAGSEYYFNENYKEFVSDRIRFEEILCKPTYVRIIRLIKSPAAIAMSFK